MTNGQPDTKWRVDKVIPIGWLAGLFVQAGVIIYAYALLNAQVAEQGRRITKLEYSIETSGKTDNVTENRITRIEEKLTNQTEILRSIRDDLSSLLRPGGR